MLHEFYRFDHRWFESIDQYRPTEAYLAVFREIFPASWQVRRSGYWYVAELPEHILPEQGWKLHISVSTRDTVAALREVFPILRDASVIFKFLVDPSIAALANSKQWPREACGKFITVYPSSMDQFYRLGHDLAGQLASFAGPYVLSDRRWPGSKCVFYRYGSFQSRSLLRSDGIRKAVIADPTGALVPDLRNPYWSPPGWVADPFPEEETQENTPADTLNNGRFSIKSALKFSNAGGVYRAHDNWTDKEVVIKEARQRVEVGKACIDAVAVLEKEYRILQRLADTGYFVQPVALFHEWEHTFLAEEFVHGEHLGLFTLRHNPIYWGPINTASVSKYLDIMKKLWVQIARAINIAHMRGIVLADLSFTNIIVTESSRITIIDLEAAFQEEIDPVVGLYTPGMANPRNVKFGMGDRSNDYYALGALMFGCLMLADSFIEFYPPARQRFIAELTEDLALPLELVELIDLLLNVSAEDTYKSNFIINKFEQLPIDAVEKYPIVPRLSLPMEQQIASDSHAKLRGKVVKTIHGITNYLRSSADPSRNDRLFPSDPIVFQTNPLSVAYGAGGVLYALQAIDGHVPGELIDWIMRQSISKDDYPPGLYMGQAGIAWVFAELGYADAAVRIMHEARSHGLLWESANVFYGAAGYGLACLKLWHAGLGEDFLSEAVRVGDWILKSSVNDERGIRWVNRDGTTRLGYAFGASGIALFLLYLHLATGNEAYLRCGRQSLDFELSHAVWVEGKCVGFPAVAEEESDQNSAPSCYWQIGTAGVCTALIRYTAVAPDPDLERWRIQLEHDVSRKYVSFPNLFLGVAGLGNYLLDAWQYTGHKHYISLAWQAAEGVLLYQIERPEGIAFPGEQAMRESADFATGAAGIAMFLNRLLRIEENMPKNFNFVVDEMLTLRKGFVSTKNTV